MHVIDVRLGTAVDLDMVDHAEADDLAIVTADTDFPMLLALRRAASPSIVLLRGINELSPDQHAALVIDNCGRSRTISDAARPCPSARTISESETSLSHSGDRVRRRLVSRAGRRISGCVRRMSISAVEHLRESYGTSAQRLGAPLDSANTLLSGTYDHVADIVVVTHRAYKRLEQAAVGRLPQTRRGEDTRRPNDPPARPAVPCGPRAGRRTACACDAGGHECI